MKRMTTMRRLLPLTGLVLMAGTLRVPAHAAGTVESAASPASLMNSITDQQLELMRMDIRNKRRQIVAANLPLTTDESAKFWPVYDKYIAETVKINDGRYSLLKEYVTNYNTMTDAQATRYIQKLIDADKTMLDLRAKYMPLVEKAVSQRKSAIFAQIDRRVQMMIELQLASQIPLINPQP